MSDTIIVHRTGQAPLRVRGEVIASSESSANNASSHYSGSPGISSETTIYKTTSGKIIVAIHHSTCWEGEHDSDEAAVFVNLKQAVDFLSERVSGWMLQELVKVLGEEEAAEDVE